MKYNTVTCGDAIELMRGIDDNSIDCIVTSPPYNIGPKKGRTRVGPNGEKVTALWRGIHDYEDTMPEEDYQEWQSWVLCEFERIIKPEGSIFYNHKVRQRNRKIIHPMEWFPRVLTLRQEIIWDRHDTHNHDKGYFYPVDERIYWLTKSRDVKFHNEGYSTVWSIPRAESSNRHNAPFPPEIPRRCIEVSTDKGDVVLDPFMGSGTTIWSARAMGRRYIGFDINQYYVDYVNGGMGHTKNIPNNSQIREVPR